MWKSINISKNNIECETDKCLLIKMPHKSEYDGYKVWISKKIAKEGRHKNAIEIIYKEGFVFSAFKKDIKEEIYSEDFENAFAISNENICSTQENLYAKHVPDKMDVIEKAEPLKELLDE